MTWLYYFWVCNWTAVCLRIIEILLLEILGIPTWGARCYWGNWGSFQEFLVSLINKFKDGHRRKLEDNFTIIKKKTLRASKLSIPAAAWRRKMEGREEGNLSEEQWDSKVLGSTCWAQSSLHIWKTEREKETRKSWTSLPEDSERQSKESFMVLQQLH